MFLFAHPLHAHRHTGQFPRNQSGVGGRVIGAVMAVTAGTFDMNQTNFCRRHTQHLGDALAVGVNALRVRPDRHDVVVELRHRTGWADRAVRLIGPRIGSFQGSLT